MFSLGGLKSWLTRLLPFDAAGDRSNRRVLRRVGVGCEICVDIVQTSGDGNCTEVTEGNKEVEGRSCAAQERSCVRLLLSRLSFVDPVPSAFHLRLL